ncbi:MULTISPECIES: GNAT family N-acetyltransferase [Brevibacillus]|uniref:GNAT family N-acetyltransferase n=1 Tax=Brevibacillus TaxID=55080 RepID=UPI00203C15D7|nr:MULTISPECIES: GNAT family N-acetyltransferase [Brevibacillus]MCM3082104.1 GNAT family N-acetyltransferase [Brevibacillus invocatus]MCM3432514.1 GNAT family N-acetyltransferase [Brevibacillus invocatus]MDH4617753.1 GNAT family N-acetyltransferase [Brevibacillus sp. AY1]
MTLLLKEITSENWEECIQLQPSEDQEHFIASNLYSLAQSKFLPNFETLAVYKDQAMVGFVMFGIDPDDSQYWIYRLMIDSNHQGKGYGIETMKQVIDRIREKPDTTNIMVAYHPENKAAASLYEKLGFKVVGKASWGEIMSCLSMVDGST